MRKYIIKIRIRSRFILHFEKEKSCAPPSAAATVERLHGMIHGTLCCCCCVDNTFFMFVCLLCFFFLLWINCMRVTHCNAEWKNSETIWRNRTKMRTAPAITITIAQTSMWLVCLAYNFIDIILAWFQAAARILILAIFGSGCIFCVAGERHEQTH